MDFETQQNYKLVFAKTGKAKELRNHAKKSIKKMAEKKISVPNVMLKISSYGKSIKSIGAHFDYVSRNGKVQVYDAMDNPIGDESESQKKALHRMAKEIKAVDKKELKNKRLTCNIILSMPPNTHIDGFKEGVADFLGNKFSNHNYTYAYHEDTACPHAHVCIPMLGMDGTRLNPRKDDLAQWREEFAQSLERNGIAAYSTPSIAKNKNTYRDDMYKYSKLTDFGVANYQFKDGNQKSYFVALKSSNGKEHKLWGKGLEGVVNDKQMQKGDLVRFSAESPKGTPEKKVKNVWSGEIKKVKRAQKLKQKTAEKVIKAWHSIEKDMRETGEVETAKMIKAFVRDTFSRRVDDKLRGLEDIEEKTR